MSRPGSAVRAACLIAAATAAAAAAAPATGQDIEARARPGVRVPSGYYDLIREKPDLFEINADWSNRLVTNSHGQAATGELRVVVIQALFADSPEPWVTREDVQRALFDGPSAYGTISEYYREVSGGHMNVTGTVTPWVRTQMTRAETVGESSGIGPTSKVGFWVVQALDEADALVDFAQFDNEGPDGIPNSGDDNGFVDAVAVQFFEIAGSCGGNGIWPHRAGIHGWIGDYYATDDIGANGEPILVNGYIVQSARECENDSIQQAGTIAHELGHVFGLPDLYHQAEGLLPAQRVWTIGCWILMAAGAWGCGDGAAWPTGRRPPHMGPWEKMRLGWITQEQVGTVRDREYILEPVQTSARSLIVPLGGPEYLQIEYRPRIGYDVDLPASGVLIYHADFSVSRMPLPGQPRRYPVALVEADGDSALVRTAAEGGDRGVAGDAWAVDGPVSLSAISKPALRLHSGALSTVTIHNIEVVGGVARVRISTDPRPALVEGQQLGTPLVMEPWSHVLRAAGGALPYSWSVEGLPDGITLQPDGDRLHLSGAPEQAGMFDVAVRITDALGTSVQSALELMVTTVALATERMLQPLIRNAAAPLTETERSYLDRLGNNNGRYDIGDLRRALLRQ